MASPELAAAIAKLLRAMPLNPIAIAIGDALKAEQANGPVAATPVAATECAGCKSRREKQRTKMQHYRKKPKPK